MVMAGTKRKRAIPLEDPTKKVKREIPSTSTQTPGEKDEETTGDDYQESDDQSSGDDGDNQDADTPITPFSPSRKFPSELKTIRCTYESCSKIFNRPARLQSHLRSHTNERPFICSYDRCDKSYMQEKHLIQHIKGSHTHERSYGCDWEGCSKSFLTATRLRRHQAAHEGHDRFRCTAYPPCNQTFRKHQTLQRHIRADHLGLVPFPCTHVDPITGVACDAGFDSSGSLRKHEDRVHGTLRVFCEECTVPSPYINSPPQPLGFTTKALLTKHLKMAHINCLFCDLSFSSQSDLQMHTEKTHEKTHEKTDTDVSSRKTVPCTFSGCEKAFTKKYNLTVHIRTAHNGERFVCGTMDISKLNLPVDWNGSNACGKDFVSKVNLEDHVRTQHLGLPSVVNAKRIRKGGAVRQVLKKEEVNAIDLVTGAAYGQDKTRNIACTVPGCPWLFTRDYDLQQHLNLKHQQAADSLSEQPYTPLATANPGPFPELAYDFADSPSADAERTFDQTDFDWDLQPGATFWIGADAGDDECNPAAQQPDSWTSEEAEMRRLIDESNATAEFLVDPALV